MKRFLAPSAGALALSSSGFSGFRRLDEPSKAASSEVPNQYPILTDLVFNMISTGEAHFEQETLTKRH